MAMFNSRDSRGGGRSGDSRGDSRGGGGFGGGRGGGRGGKRGDKDDKRSKRPTFIVRKKYCRFCKDDIEVIDYKDTLVLEKMVSDYGKMLSRRVTGNCARHQRKIAEVVKRARFLSIIPYIKR